VASCPQGARDGLRRPFSAGYCPPSIRKHKNRNTASGVYSGNLTDGMPDGFGSATW
jgi:hypothetical protein